MKPLIEWVFTNVLIAFVPILMKLAIIILSKIKLPKWYEVIQDGELYIFSLTLSASAIVLRVFQEQNINSLEGVFIIILRVDVIVSALMFSLASYLKLIKSDLETALNLKIYAIASIACSILAIFSSYYISGVR
ncbi:MAG: hypothetical protein V7K48_17235 [Nostoc sp.]|uniref:hypothetical protein n=1 Tax=Nostoc sp. TaxID=1180 RepID=UPI002FFA655A